MEREKIIKALKEHLENVIERCKEDEYSNNYMHLFSFLSGMCPEMRLGDAYDIVEEVLKERLDKLKASLNLA